MSDPAKPAPAFACIASFTSVGEADVARGLLESAGIPCQLGDEATIGIAWHLSNALGGVKLLVDSTQADEAKRLLAEGLSPLSDDELAAEAGATSEPSSPVEARAAEEAEPADALAQRAFRTAIIGFVLFPFVVHLYSIYLLIRLDRVRGTLSSRGRRHATWALVLNCVVMALALAIVLNRV